MSRSPAHPRPRVWPFSAALADVSCGLKPVSVFEDPDRIFTRNKFAQFRDGKAQIIDGTVLLEAVGGGCLPWRPLTVMTAHTFQPGHP
jgi:hypothetical protein